MTCRQFTTSKLCSAHFRPHSIMNFKLILVQDSDVRRRARICRILMLSGCQVLEAVNRQHAESICDQKGLDVDLIVADAESSFEWVDLCPHAHLLSLPIEAGVSRTPATDNAQSRVPFSAEQLLIQVRLTLGIVK